MNQSNECLSFGSDKNVLKTVVKIAERPTFHKMEAVWPVLFMVSWLSSYGKAAPNGNEGE